MSPGLLSSFSAYLCNSVLKALKSIGCLPYPDPPGTTSPPAQEVAARVPGVIMSCGSLSDDPTLQDPSSFAAHPGTWDSL